MTIADYTSLKVAVASWLMREDLVDQIPTFIQLGEAEINRVLRTKEMMQRSTSVITSQYILLPEGWLKAKNIQRSDGYPLEYLTPPELDKYRWELSHGRAAPEQGPVYYSLVGDTMELAPAPTADEPTTVEMLYYKKVPSLSSSSPSNWLILTYPDIYLYATLIASAPFLMEDDRIATWQGLFEKAVQQANAAAEQARMSGAPMSRRIRTF